MEYDTAPATSTARPTSAVPIDEIRLTGLRVRGHHGVFDHEKRDGQEFVVDAVLRRDLSRPAASDDLADTVDYGTLADTLAAIVAGPPFDLIEALAGALVEACLEVCDDAEVTVHKPQAPITHAFADVAVTLRRTRAGTTGRTAATQGRITAAGNQTPASPLVRAVISLGANLGDAPATLQTAVHALDLHPRITVLAGSPIYVTAPVGGVEQPDFHNAAVLVETTLPPRELLAVCQGVEVSAGRTREVRWGPRTLDLDLIAAVDATTGAALRSTDPVLTLPHPRAHERAFVLAPWSDLDPDATLETAAGPQPVRTLLDRLPDADDVRRTATDVRGRTTASGAGSAAGGDRE
ncbi:2-amino-4-hydroxy-6-hydroxymethyldihydropteridine diphosphokinase [Brevibacterium senegalense]|uniref:2-amino-4-hydroxy-6- hydroxymethyldihydropteridine diphosphokinase n=1 Tax=Brevibacterium senegalense TaxID=1033736 RepID=UPI0002FA2C79|nr:2-amino-4-hydroxy-6-hydroxymethyldihydropteridine diphosphokinase [Brevibacterium senegalense]